MNKRTEIMRNVIDAIAILTVPMILSVCAFLHMEYFSIVALFTVGISCLLMMTNWDLSRPGIESIMLASVFGTVAAGARILFAAIPNVQPVTAICVLGGCFLGKRNGFLVGVLAAAISNCVLGQGPWTPWQMYSWGISGYFAGVLFSKRAGENPLMLVIYGGLVSYLFGFLMNTWMLLSFVNPLTWQAAIVVYSASFALDTIHSVSTISFLAILFLPWSRRIARIRSKYGELAI